MLKKLTVIFCILCFVSLGQNMVYGYGDNIAHPELTKEAVKKSVLNEFIINSLGFSEGIEQWFTNPAENLMEKNRSQSVLEWLRFGSTYEDTYKRASNHFHNPLNNEGQDEWVTFNAPGWFVFFPIPFHYTGISNKNWAMGVAEDGTDIDICDGLTDEEKFRDEDCNDYSYRQARMSYYEALTGEDENKRNANFAMVFEKLGRVIHLIEDMGVPAHTRNDMWGHLDYTRYVQNQPSDGYDTAFDKFKNKLASGNLYEYWVDCKISSEPSYLETLCTPDNVIVPMFSTPEEYWDQEIYKADGTFNPDDTLPASGEERAGLAEYTSSNYLSKCALFTEEYDTDDKKYFPYPRKACLDNVPPTLKQITAEDANFDMVLHLHKLQDGEIFDNEPFVKYSYTWKDINDKGDQIDPELRRVVGRLCYVLDDEVHETYARRLLPKTVGYSAGLLDYFFRGKLDITVNNDATVIDPNPFRKCIDHLELTVTNTTPDEAMTEGRLVLVVKYRMAEDEPYQYITGDISESFSLGTGMTSDTISPDFPFDPYNSENTKQGIPLDAQEASIYIVYRGQLGTEEDGIAVGMLRDLNSGSEDGEASNVRDFIPETAQGLEIRLPKKKVYSYTELDPASSDPATEGFGHFAFHLTNNTSEDISMENGEITAVIRYRVSESNPFTDYGVEGPPDTSSEYYKIIRTASGVDGVAGGAWFPFEADLASENIPLWATDLFLYVLYRSGGVFFIITKNIYEPTPVHIFNSTDKVCLYDTLYETDSQAAQDIMEEHDEWDKEPEIYEDFFLKFSSGDALPASDSCAPRNLCDDCVYPEQENIPPGGYHRIFILGDKYYSYGVSFRSDVRKKYEISKRFTCENQFWKAGSTGRTCPVFHEYETSSGVLVTHGYQLIGNTCFGCGTSDENPCYFDLETGCY